MNAIGKGKFKDFDAFCDWYMSAGLEWYAKHWSEHFYKLQSDGEKSEMSKAFHSLGDFGCSGFPSRENHGSSVDYRSGVNLKNLKRINTYICNMGLFWDVRHLSNEHGYAYITFGGKDRSRYIIPHYKQGMKVELFQDYSGLNAGQLRRMAITGNRNADMIAAGSLIPAGAGEELGQSVRTHQGQGRDGAGPDRSRRRR